MIRRYSRPRTFIPGCTSPRLPRTRLASRLDDHALAARRGQLLPPRDRRGDRRRVGRCPRPGAWSRANSSGRPRPAGRRPPGATGASRSWNVVPSRGQHLERRQPHPVQPVGRPAVAPVGRPVAVRVARPRPPCAPAGRPRRRPRSARRPARPPRPAAPPRPPRRRTRTARGSAPPAFALHGSSSASSSSQSVSSSSHSPAAPPPRTRSSSASLGRRGEERPAGPGVDGAGALDPEPAGATRRPGRPARPRASPCASPRTHTRCTPAAAVARRTPPRGAPARPGAWRSPWAPSSAAGRAAGAGRRRTGSSPPARRRPARRAPSTRPSVRGLDDPPAGTSASSSTSGSRAAGGARRPRRSHRLVPDLRAPRPRPLPAPGSAARSACRRTRTPVSRHIVLLTHSAPASACVHRGRSRGRGSRSAHG